MIDPDGGDGRRGWGEWLSEFFRSDNTGGVFYGWRLVAIGFLVILVGREIATSVVTMPPDELLFDGFSIAAPFVIAFGVIGGLLSFWLAGWGTDRLGPRRMAQIGLPLVGLVTLLVAAPIPGVLQAAFSVLTALGLIAAYVPAITVLNHWFRDRLALALSLMLFGVAVGGALVDWLLSVALMIAEWWVDWWVVIVAFGAAITVVALPLARVIRDHPEDSGERPDGFIPAVETTVPDYPWREAMRSRQFWMLMAAGGCVAVASSIASLYNWSVIAQGSATFEAVDKLGLFEKFGSTAGILIGGLASYRFSIIRVLSAAAVFQAVGIALLLSGVASVLLETAVLLGIASAMATAPGIAVVGIYFGRRSFGAIIVTTFLINQVVSSAVLASAGYTIQLIDSFAPIFVAAAIISLIGAGLYLALGQPRLSPSQRRLVSQGAGALD